MFKGTISLLKNLRTIIQDSSNKMSSLEIKRVTTSHAEIRVPSIAFVYCDRTGHVSLWGCTRMFGDCFRMVMYKGFSDTPSFLQGSDIRIFEVRHKMMFNPEYHQKLSSGVDMPFRVCLDLFYETGRKSFDVVVSAYEESTGNLLMMEQSKSVFFNQKTNVTATPPAWYIQKYANVNRKKIPEILMTQKSITPPASAFQTSIRTRFCDTDDNFHVNSCEYFRFCSECASEASVSGYYRRFTSDISWYPMSEFDVTFIGQCPPCEMITVTTWQDENDVTKIFFSIELKSKQIFQAVAVYNTEKSPYINLSKI